MKISVITPTFNSEKTIAGNIQSIISQTYKDFEHIIIDNISTDKTIELVKNYYLSAGIVDRLIIISEKDNGISDAFNKGIKAASGEIIAILNSDDAYYNDRVFEEAVNIFRDPEIFFMHGDVYFEDPVYGSNIRKPLLCLVTTAMPYNHPTMFLRKEIYEKFGLYDLSYKYAMDYEFIIKLEKVLSGFKEKGKYFFGHPVAIMYSGGASWMNELKSIEESKRALKKYGFWDFTAKKNHLFRVFRSQLKKYLSILNFNFIVKIWRNWKWKREELDKF